MKNIIVTGAGGFIGSALCSRLSSDNKVIGVDKVSTASPESFVLEQIDLIDFDSVDAICEKYSPDIVIHCAGIAHQKIGAVDFAAYMRVNSEATENLAKAAAKSNPDVRFIFLSSVSVYGEGPQINPQITQITQNEKDVSRKGDPQITQITRIKRTKTNNNAVDEGGKCWPSSDYAVSKLDAERRLIALFDVGEIHNLTILRLAPVYDREWSFNLDRRVLAPGKLAYLRFGSGLQRMSALARPNLVDFIDFLIHRFHRLSQITDKSTQQNNLQIFNVCDAESYEFNRIIEVFKNSGIHANRPAISVPLSLVWILTHMAGILFAKKRKWLHSCYDKLASSLVFDNTKMLKTGFKPKHSMETIFNPQINYLTQRRKDAKKKTI